MDILLDTIRGEIAVCVEKAYEKLSLKDAARMLYLPNEEAAKVFGTKVRKCILNRIFFCIIAFLDKEMEIGQGQLFPLCTGGKEKRRTDHTVNRISGTSY